jgi:hypothetical protein
MQLLDSSFCATLEDLCRDAILAEGFARGRRLEGFVEFLCG